MLKEKKFIIIREVNVVKKKNAILLQYLSHFIRDLTNRNELKRGKDFSLNINLMFPLKYKKVREEQSDN